MLTVRLRKLGHRANVSVEFALISTFFLLPLFAGTADFLLIVSAQSQLNTALQALYYFAWTNPTIATSSTYINNIAALINFTSFHQINAPTATATYFCITPPSATPASQTSPCTTGQQTTQAFVTYRITSSVSLPVPIPFGLSNPFPLSASGMVQIQ